MNLKRPPLAKLAPGQGNYVRFRLSPEVTIAVGARVKLDFAAGGLIDAEVRWTKGTQFGCQFLEKFDLKLLQPPAPVAKASRIVAPDYLKQDGGAK